MRRVTIVQGDYRVETTAGVTITTLLGSCVAVCLHDGVARVGGMNHFLLGTPGEDVVLSIEDRRRYGIHAMELLINEMMKQGALRARLQAHVYGGATIIAGLGAIGRGNARFALDFLAAERIPLAHCDLGGTHARRVEFRPYDGKSRSIALSASDPVRPPALRPADNGDVELFA